MIKARKILNSVQQGLILVLMIIALPGLEAQYIKVDDSRELAEKLNGQASSIQSIYAHFTQEKRLDFLDETIVSEGQFWFRKENQLRWAYEHPFEYAIIISGGKFYIRDGEQLSSYDIESNAAFREINELIVSMVRGNVMREDKFSIEAFENAEHYLVKLSPREEQVKEVISRMEIYFGKSDLMVEKIVMKESEVDYTEILFSDRKTNERIPDSVFSVDR